MARDSKIAPQTAIIQFPDEQINQPHIKIISCKNHLSTLKLVHIE